MRKLLYGMTFVRKDNPRAETSGFISRIDAQTIQLHSNCTSMHLHIVHCEILDVKQWDIN